MSEIKERLSAPKILSSPTSEAGPSTVMSDFSALGSLCSAYASDSGDNEEPAGIFKCHLLKVKILFYFFQSSGLEGLFLAFWCHANGWIYTAGEQSIVYRWIFILCQMNIILCLPIIFQWELFSNKKLLLFGWYICKHVFKMNNTCLLKWIIQL